MYKCEKYVGFCQNYVKNSRKVVDSARKSQNNAVFLWTAWFCTNLQPQAWPFIFSLYLSTVGQFSFYSYFYGIFHIDIMVILTRLQFSCKDNVSKTRSFATLQKKAINWSHNKKRSSFIVFIWQTNQIYIIAFFCFSVVSTGPRLQLELGCGSWETTLYQRRFWWAFLLYRSGFGCSW